MSPRDELANLLDRHLTDGENEHGCRLLCGYDADDRSEHLADAILAAGYVKPDASSEARAAAFADDNDPDYWRRVYIIGVDERVRLEDRLREARKAAETQRKVADAYLEALQDEYRPHVAQNKAYGLAIGLLEEEGEQLRATIGRVKELCRDTGMYQAAARGGRFSGARSLAVEILAVLEEQAAADPQCPCTTLQALHDASTGDYMHCADCGTRYHPDGHRL
ncbi:hypothetical protein GS461_09840 [Rhodococcus hoagii]|nr:hypothetical protein [Prescottella equi]